MGNIKIAYNNNRKVSFLLIALFAFLILFFVIPFWFVNYLSFSGVSHFLNKYSYLSIFPFFILIYFLLTGKYYYFIKIDSYSIQIESYNAFLGFFRDKDYIDISNDMLFDYAFFNRSYSLNKTMMIKFKGHNNKKVVKRFTLTLIKDQEIKRISDILDKLILKNS